MVNKEIGVDHYWNNENGDEIIIDIDLLDNHYKLASSKGLFSFNKIDLGTKVLIDYIDTVPNQVLDLGCGWGPITYYLALKNHNSSVYYTDINKRALEIVGKNSKTLKLKNTIQFDQNTHIKFDTIYSNPPIKVGKDETIRLIKQYSSFLNPNGYMLMVIQNNLGASSIMNKLSQNFVVSKEKSKKGYSIIKLCQKNPL